MAHLFSSLMVHTTRLRNRIVLAAYPSGQASVDGLAHANLIAYYHERAEGGVGLVLVEAAQVTRPSAVQPHLGIYADAQVPELARLVATVQQAGAATLLTLHAQGQLQGWSTSQLEALRDAYVAAARRAREAGAAGVALALADGSPLQQLVSPRFNRRDDEYGGDAPRRLRLLLELVEGLRRQLGPDGIISLRLALEEAHTGGLSMADSRVIARRLVASGVSLIDITLDTPGTAPLARFPGWRVPLAATLKPLIDVPIMVGGGLDDPLLADSVVRDGSVDLVVIGRALRHDPLWPQQARHAIALAQLDLG
jgi:2,4-dienoyl-CoA reductase-like NADH-dependent reductase (Old Yellow Enzyme family)